jgi:N6-L-threonylcarbamoyladenine synthase
MLEKIAAKHPASNPYSFPEFPLAMQGSLGFSFGGLVSSVQRLITKLGPAATEDSATQAAIAHAFQHAAVGQLQEKLMLALRSCERRGIAVKTVVSSGGVASNMHLRSW